VTTLIVLYAYILEPSLAFYGRDLFERQFTDWRMTGWISWAFYTFVPFNALIPLLFVFRKVRRSLPWLFVIAILVDIGMWVERFWIVAGSTARDFLPHNWGTYRISVVETLITAGALAFFLFFFLAFAKLLPAVPISDYKARTFEGEEGRGGERGNGGGGPEETSGTAAAPPDPARGPGRLVASFGHPRDFTAALRRLAAAGVKDEVEVRTPIRVPEVGAILGRARSPVRLWTLAGGVAGFIGGYALCILTARENDLIVHGKPAVQLIPFLIVGFELMVLTGALANLAGLLVHAGLLKKKRKRPDPGDDAFRRDRFGIVVSGPEAVLDAASAALRERGNGAGGEGA
jgi:molybdopterin-containing oxidoreductase family membrane subunit